LILIVALLTATTLFGQNQYATTTNGKKVLLKDNGTWEYVTTSKTTTGQTNRVTSGTSTTPRTKAQSSSSSVKSTGRRYIRGPRGGCYYINKNGGKTYVDRSMCN